MSTSLVDGPHEPDAFSWKGTTYTGLRPTAWRLLAELWGAHNHAVHVDRLGPVFDLHDPPARHQYAPTASRANAWFRWHALPLSIRCKNRHVQLVVRPE